MGNFDTKIAKVKTALENIFLKKTDAADTYQPKGNYATGNHTHTTGSITDFPSTITPSSHTHGDITNDGKIGSTSGKPIITTTNGKLTTGNFGASSGQFAEGNHTHSNYLTNSDINGKLNISQTNYKGKNVVVDSSSGEITFEDKPTFTSLGVQEKSTTTINLTGGVSGKTCTMAFYRIGQIVFFRLYGTFDGSTYSGSSMPYSKTVNTGNALPEEYRPIAEVRVHMGNYGSVNVDGMSVSISTGGTVHVTCRDKTKTMLYNCTGTYITNYTPA